MKKALAYSLALVILLVGVLPAIAQVLPDRTRITGGTSLPANCRPRDLFYLTAANPTVGLYTCPIADQWALMATTTGALPGGNFLVSGGGVSWVSGYTFRVSAAQYVINGNFYTSVTQDITLNAADPTLNRIDSIILDTTGTVGKITGEAAAPPFEPSADPLTQLGLTHVLVTAGSTEPGVTITLIYDEHAGPPTEWTAVPNAGALDVDSTNNPFSGTIDIEGTNVAAGNQVSFTAGTPVIMSNQDAFVLYVRVKAAWPANKRIRLLWFAAGLSVGQILDIRDGTFGFNSQLVGVYQQIVVPPAQFAIPSGQFVDQLILRIVGGGANVGMYLDFIQLQAGLDQPPVAGVVPASPVGSIQINADGQHLGAYAGAACSAGQFASAVATSGALTCGTPAGTGAPTDAEYWVGAANGTLSAEKNLGALGTGLVINTAGVPSAYTGVTCTDQHLSALNASGAGTCTTDVLASAQHANQGSTTTVLHGNAAGNPSWGAVVSADLNITTTSCTNQFVSAISSGGVGTCTSLASAAIPVAHKRRVCAMVVGADNGTALVNADLGPQGKQCFIPYAATIVEVTVAADAGTPSALVRRITAGGSANNILSGALATAASGAVACSNTGGTTGLDGSTTCTNTLQNTAIAAGEYLELLSGSASTAKRMSIFVTYTVD